MNKDTIIEDVGSGIVWTLTAAMMFGLGAVEMINKSNMRTHQIVSPKETFQKCLAEVASVHQIGLARAVTTYDEVVIWTNAGFVQKNYDLRNGIVAVKVRGVDMPSRHVADLAPASSDRRAFDAFNSCYKTLRNAEWK